MLILTRRCGETVNIGHDVTVTVLGIKAAPGPPRHQSAQRHHRRPRGDLPPQAPRTPRRRASRPRPRRRRGRCAESRESSGRPQ
jgi:hypothetical protein